MFNKNLSNWTVSNILFDNWNASTLHSGSFNAFQTGIEVDWKSQIVPTAILVKIWRISGVCQRPRRSVSRLFMRKYNWPKLVFAGTRTWRTGLWQRTRERHRSGWLSITAAWKTVVSSSSQVHFHSCPSYGINIFFALKACGINIRNIGCFRIVFFSKHFGFLFMCQSIPFHQFYLLQSIVNHMSHSHHYINNGIKGSSCYCHLS